MVASYLMSLFVTGSLAAGNKSLCSLFDKRERPRRKRGEPDINQSRGKADRSTGGPRRINRDETDTVVLTIFVS